MANSVKLLNYLDPDGDFLRFYTELDSGFEIGNKVFIIGGNYDNTSYTDKTSPDYNPYHPYATGYEVVAIDNTSLSNAVTLNISYKDVKFTSAGINTFIFDPKAVYKTEEELIVNPNQIREAFISKSYFKKGEFNGGKFQDGIFGEFNIKGESSTTGTVYNRQHFVDILREKALASNDEVTVAAIDAYDYVALETPVSNNKAVFNNNYKNVPAVWNGGVFLGGDWQWGEANTKYNDNKTGKKQKLNDNTGIRNLIDSSKYDIESFDDNNGGVGYNMVVSGNWGRIYSNVHNDVTFTEIGTTITMDYIPFQLREALNHAFNVQIKIGSLKNNRVFDVETINNNTIILKSIQEVDLGLGLAPFTFEQLVFNESGNNLLVEIYVKDSPTKPNRLNTGRILNIDWFGGTFDNGRFEGGDWHSGEFRSGVITSLYQNVNWYNGIFNGKENSAVAENLKWHNGTWIDGNWKGDNNVPLTAITHDGETIRITIQSKYKHLFEVGKDVFLSYFKRGVINSYLDNFTDLQDVNLLNFQTFNLIDIEDKDLSTDNDNTYKVVLVLSGKIDLTDVNVQNAKISQSFFNKGIWKDGIWESGLRKVSNNKIVSFNSSSFDSSSSFSSFKFTVSSTDGIEYGDPIEVTNLNLIRNLDIKYLSDFSDSERDDQEYVESLDLTLHVLNINSSTNEITAKLPDLTTITTEPVNISLDGSLKAVRIIESNINTQVGTALWWNGQFRSGVWDGGIWKNGELKNDLYFDLANNQIQSVWKNGHWKAGLWENGAFLSGVWQSGVWEDGIMTNTLSVDSNNETIGESVWLDGIWKSGTWRRGLFKAGKMVKGTIINAGIDSIDWTEGEYTNGFGIFSNTVNINKSGRFIESNVLYDNLSAPSLIYIDRDGWVQLDQPSFYQNDYNIIFQDLGLFENPYNNEMFNIIDHDQYSTRVKVLASTSGGVYDNPLTVGFTGPVLAADNIVDIAEAVNDGSNHIVLIADNGHNRILAVDKITGNIDVYGKIIGNSDTDKYVFSDITLMGTSDENVYVVDVNTVKKINLGTKDIITLVPTLLSNENIIDILVIKKQVSETLETLFLLTDANNLYYWNETFTSFKSILLYDNSTVTTSNQLVNVKTFTGYRGLNTSRVNLIINATDGTLQSKLFHAILDFSQVNSEYKLSTDIDSTQVMDNSLFVELTLTKNIKSVVSKFETGFIKLWILFERNDLVAGDVDTEQLLYYYEYKNYFLGTTNNKFINLNDSNVLNFSVDKFRLGINSDYLLALGKKDDSSVLFASASLKRNISGFINPASDIKLYDVFQDNSTSGYKYWVVDNAQHKKRIAYVNQANEELYNSDFVISYIDSNATIDIKKLVPGDNSTVIYGFATLNGYYRIIKALNNAEAPDNQTIYDDKFDIIYDIVFIEDSVYILGSKSSNGFGLYRLQDIDGTVTDTYYNLLLSTGLAVPNYLNYKFDGVTDGDNLFFVVWASNNSGLNVLYELRVVKDTVGTSYLVDMKKSFSKVSDIAISYSTVYFNHYNLFVATTTSVYKFIAPTNVVELVNSKPIYRWSKYNEQSESIYTGSGIKEVYRYKDKLVINYGITFDLIDMEYKTESYNIDSAVYYGTTVYALSDQRLLKITNNGSTIEVLKGYYKQISTFPFTDHSILPSGTDQLLNNPSSLILAKNFNSEDVLFYIDNINDAFYDIAYVRGYNITTNTHFIKINAVIPNSNSFIYDLAYCESDSSGNVMYLDINNGSRTAIAPFTNSTTINLSDLSNTYSDYNQYDKFSVQNTSDGITYIGCNLNYVDILGTGTTIFYDSEIQIKDITFNTTPSFYEVIVIDYFGASYLLRCPISSDINNTANWSEILGLEFTTTNFVGEYINTPSDNNILLVKDNNDVCLIETTTLHTEDGVYLKDMAFTSLTNDSNNIYFLNDPVSGPKGIIRQTIKNSINLNLLNQKDHLSTGVFKKMIALDNNKVYALFNEAGTNALYSYNFNSFIQPTKLNSGLPGYRDGSEPYPSLSNYKYNPIDIAIYDNTNLVALSEIIDNSNPLIPVRTGRYDLVYYNSTDIPVRGNLSTLSYLYSDSIDAILSDGTVNTNRYPTSGSGGLSYIFKSSTAEPRLYVKKHSTQNSVYFYINDGSANFLKVIKESTVNSQNVYPIQNSVYDDLIYKIYVPGYNIDQETPIQAIINFNDIDSTVITSTTFYSYNNLGPISSTVLQNVDEFAVKFDKPVGGVFPSVANATITFTFSLSSTQVPSFTNVYDFRVYAQSSGIAGFTYDKISIRELVSDSLICVSDNNVAQLTKPGTGQWKVEAVGTSDDKNILSLIDSTVNTLIDVDDSIADLELFKLQLTILPLLNVEYNFKSLLNDNKNYDETYKVLNTGSQVLSPYVTGRVLFNTIINEGVLFNNNGNSYSAHVVSTTWKNGLFVGTWDAPFYIDYSVIEKYSVFIDGIFEGNFHDGFFLGGTFRNKSSNVKSNILQGHFRSDVSDITWESGIMNSDLRYDITRAKVEDNKLTLTIDAIKFSGDDYTKGVFNKIVKGSVIQIPSLFKKSELSIIDITAGNLSVVNGKDEIILKVEKPQYYHDSFWNNIYVFITSVEYPEYFFGESLCTKAYTDDDFMYLVIQSEFKEFVDGVFSPVNSKVLVGHYFRISDREEVDGQLKIYLDVPTLSLSILPQLSDRLKSIQKYYFIDSVDVITIGEHVGEVVIPDHLQLFNFTFNKSVHDISITFESSIQNAYFQDIISDDNSSIITVSIPGNLSGTCFAKDITVNNSYITSSNTQDWIENSIFLSGQTDRHWKSGAWLNIDDRGFSKGKSTFSNSDLIDRKFEGTPIKIIDIFFEGDSYMWIELETIIPFIDVYRYITLRGFTGNKSNIIGSTRSKVYRILEVDNNWVKVKNPTKAYKHLNTSNLYLTDFNKDELQLQTQTMSIKDISDVSKDVSVVSPNINKTFDYGYASVSCWNGGNFYGVFESVWNGGNFMDGNFTTNGLWFNSPESHNWQGLVNVTTEDENTHFLITLDLNNCPVEDKDLIYVQFNSKFTNNVIVDTLEGFYGVVESTSGSLIVKHETPNQLDGTSGQQYAINLTRYRKDYINYQATDDILDLQNNNLIVDFNSNIAPSNSINLYMDRNVTTNGTNLVIPFDQFKNNIPTIDFINLGLNDGSNGEFGVDLWFCTGNTIANKKYPLFGFHSSDSITKGGFKVYIQNNIIYLEYAEISNANKIVPLHTIRNYDIGIWNHIAIFYNNGFLKYIVYGSNTNNVYTYSAIDMTSIGNLWDLKSYDINFIGFMLSPNGNDIESSYFVGEMDEIRFWNKDVYTLFYNEPEFRTRKFVNSYIPEIMGYYSGDGKQLDHDALYPEEENYLIFNDINKSEIVVFDSSSGYAPNNIFVEMDFLAMKNGTNFTEYKILTLKDERFVDTGKPYNYYLELFLADNNQSSSGSLLETDTFSLIIRECVTAFSSGPVISSNQEVTTLFETNIKFWTWNNIILSENEIYINGSLIGTYQQSYRNLFKQNINTKIYIGDTENLTASNTPLTLYKAHSTVDHGLRTPSYFRGFVRNVNIWKRNVKNDYIIYRILSAENIENFQGNGTHGIGTINSNDPANIVIPTFNSDGSTPWQHYIYTTENYYSDDNGQVYTRPLGDVNSIVPDDFDSDLKFKDVNLLETALPDPTWLSGTDFINLNSIFQSHGGLDDGSAVINVSNMNNFKLFGKSVFNPKTGLTSMTISTNGFMSFVNDNQVTFSTYSYSDISTFDDYKKFSTQDIIYLLFSDLNLATYGTCHYADRENEIVIKLFADYYNGVTRQTTNSNLYNYIAIRIDKINSNILFYNRRIRPNPSHQKIQGIRRSDRTWNYINDPTLFSYYKYRTDYPTLPEYSVGYNYKDNIPSGINPYDDNGSNPLNPGVGNDVIKYNSDSTEYILYVPRFADNSIASFVPYISTKDYDVLNQNKVELLVSFDESKDTAGDKNSFLYRESILGSGTQPQYTNYYSYDIATTSGLVYTSGSNVSYNFSEQFSLTSKDYQVSRESFFYNGTFDAPIWHNGIFVNGTVSNNDFIWKYGIKHNGNISAKSFYKIYPMTTLAPFGLLASTSGTAFPIIKKRIPGQGAGYMFDGPMLSLKAGKYKARARMRIKQGASGSPDPILVSMDVRQDKLYNKTNSDIIYSQKNILQSIDILIDNVFDYYELDFELTSDTQGLEFKIYYTAHTGSELYIDYIEFLSSDYTEVQKYPNLQWLGGFHIGENDNSSVSDLIWHRGYFDGGRWNSGQWLSLDLQSNYLDQSYNYWSVFNGGEWYSNYISDQSTSGSNGAQGFKNIYEFRIVESIWHGGIWNSPVISGQTYSYQANNNKFYKVRNGREMELPEVSSIWLGGMWLRGEWNGGIFVNGYWHSQLPVAANGGGGAYGQTYGFDYDETYSTWNGGQMLNSIWEGGVVRDNGHMLETVFGDILSNFEYISVGSDFIWDDTEFKFKNSNFTKTVLGKKVFNFNQRSYDVGNSKFRVTNQFNIDGVCPVYWKRGTWENGVFQFSYWENLTSTGFSDNNIISSAATFDSVFEAGCFYSSYWKNGKWLNKSTSNSYPNAFDTEKPNSVFYRSEWEKGYWKSDGITADVSDVTITDGLFSRSVWNAGVFEGGIFDLSVWRSGVSQSNVVMRYNMTSNSGGSKLLIPYASASQNYTYYVDNGSHGVVYPTNTVYTSIDPTTTFNNLQNDMTFMSVINVPALRFTGGVDNVASIFVNGWMRGSVWHGGIWERGMFSHRDFTVNDQYDFFDDIITTPYQLGIWTRGIWMSGYFSYYNDLKNSPTIGTNYYLNPTNGKRCLFMGLLATGSTSISTTSTSKWNNESILGFSSTDVDSSMQDIKDNPTTTMHNFASILSRKMNKINPKKYFSIFNGTMVNGVLFNNSNGSNGTEVIASVYSLIGGYYFGENDSTPAIIINISFDTQIKASKELLNINYNIDYTKHKVLVYDGGVWTSDIKHKLDTFFYNGNSDGTVHLLPNSIWRHDHPVVGDGTTSLPPIAQGVGLVWNNGEVAGEPYYYNGLTKPI